MPGKGSGVGSWLVAAVIGALVLAMATSTLAQETTAGIQGTVKDQSGALVANATVEVSGTSLIGVKSLKTDSAGSYRFTNLPPGTYKLTVSAHGFRVYRLEGLTLETGKLPTIDVGLEVGVTAEIVEVTGSAPLVDVSQSKVQTNVTSAVLDNVPAGRSFQSVIQFAPGARAEPLQGGPAGTSTVPGQLGFQVDGSGNSENSYLVEGQETAVGGGDEGIDLEERRVGVEKRLVKIRKKLHCGIDLLGFQPEPESHLARLKRFQAHARIDVLLQNRVGIFGGYLLNIHSARGRGHEHGLALHAVEHDPPVDRLTKEFPIRLTTGRRLDSFNTGVQTNEYTSPLRRKEALLISPADGQRLGIQDGERVMASSRRGSVEVPVRFEASLRPGLAFLTLHFPDQVATNILTIDATDPKSGTAEFKASAIRIERLTAGATA